MDDHQLIPIIILSLKVAGLAIALTLPAATFIGYILARWRFPGHGLINALVYMPLVMPPVVTGFLLLEFFGPKGVAGSFLANYLGLELGFRWTGAALAAGIIALPLIVRPIKLAFEHVDQHLIDDSRLLGASTLTTFFTISLPFAIPGIASGAVLGFAKALGEFGATITFVSNIPGETQTISLGVYSLMQSPDGDRDALILVCAAIILSLAAIFASEWFVRRFTMIHGNSHD